MKYLDLVGLTNVWNEMIPHVIFYGTSSTLSNVQEKLVMTSGLHQIVEGTRLIVRFENANTHETPTLEVRLSDGTSQTYPIIDENGNTISKAGAGRIRNYCEFLYNGSGYWVLISNNFDTQIIYTANSAEPAGDEGMIWLKKKSTV